MRVLWISHSSRIGGAELSIAEFVHALERRGHELHVVMPSEGPLGERLRPSSIVHVEPHNPWAGGHVGLGTRARWAAYDAGRSIPALARIIREAEADLVVTSTITVPSGAFAARLARRPHAWFLHEYGPPYHGAEFLFGARLSTSLMNRLSSEFLVGSQALFDRFADRFGVTKMRRVTFWVDVPELPPPAPRPGAPLRLVLSGEKSPGKGQHEAIEALGSFVREGGAAELVLLGSGPPEYERRLRELAQEHGVAAHVRFEPFSPRALEIVNDADVVLMCSRQEGFGRVTIEAQKLGKPVLGARSGATPELVRHGETGLLYEPGNPVELAAAIRTVDENRDLLVRMGREGQTWARRTFSERTCGESLDQALAALVDNRG